MLAFFQLFGIVACLLSAAVNMYQALRLKARRKELDKQLRPVCQVIMHNEGERQLGIIGNLPDAGTVLYVLDKPPTKPVKEAFHA